MVSPALHTPVSSINWIPPAEGTLKINVDVALRGEGGLLLYKPGGKKFLRRMRVVETAGC